MAKVNYSVDADPETTSKAMGYEMDISPKHAKEIANVIRGMHVTEAKDYLEDVIARKKPVPFKKHKRHVAHRKGMDGWDAGRYPEKASRAIMRVIENAEANAEYKGLEPERMKIKHIATKTGMTQRGIYPRAYGRATPKRKETVTVELILEEL